MAYETLNNNYYNNYYYPKSQQDFVQEFMSTQFTALYLNCYNMSFSLLY